MDRNNYILDSEKQLSDKNVYKDVFFNEKILQDLVVASNQLFQNLKSKSKIGDKLFKYFTHEHKKVSNLGKLHVLGKIHERLHNIPRGPVIGNYETPTEKASEFLDYQLKPIMQSGKSSMKGSGDFSKKIKNLQNIPETAILVTADVVGLYPSNPHETGLNAFRKVLDNRGNKHIPADFV